MTATTTLPTTRTSGARRPLWAQAAFALAGAAIGSVATLAVIDDDTPAASARAELSSADATRSSAVSVSADAAEAHALSRASERAIVSPDAMERQAAAELAARRRACTYSATPADVVERCLNGG